MIVIRNIPELIRNVHFAKETEQKDQAFFADQAAPLNPVLSEQGSEFSVSPFLRCGRFMIRDHFVLHA